MKNKQDYRYALDNESNLVHIEKAVKSQKFLCPCCGDEMIAKQGKIRKWHFTHKTKTANCSYETYLHKIAKKRIRECFMNSDEFNIQIETTAFCSIKDCNFPFKPQKHCQWRTSKNFNLKKYYNDCTEEQRIGRFVADLLLSNNKNEKPILIEICVSHKCTEEKIKSGYRIIEIHIKSEDDIDKIVTSKEIKGYSPDVNEWYCYAQQNDTTFYNFEISEKPNSHQEKSIAFFWIDRYNYVHSKLIRGCVNSTRLPKNILNSKFIIQSSEKLWHLGFKKLSESGLNLKYCPMCKNYRYNYGYQRHMCILYKKNINQKFPKLINATTCSEFTQIDYLSTPEELYSISESLLKTDYSKECIVTINKPQHHI